MHTLKNFSFAISNGRKPRDNVDIDRLIYHSSSQLAKNQEAMKH